MTQSTYISYKEVRKTGKGGRSLKWFLVDSAGAETLCAIGEETTQGDAHYFYHNDRHFTKYGTLACHNRRELHQWLDKIIEDSSRDSPTKPEVGTFVSHRQEKFHFSDGRRGIRFYLVDESGKHVSAVLGEERDTRDGHYTYRTDPALSGGTPLSCGNLTGVHRWLRAMMEGGQGSLEDVARSARLHMRDLPPMPESGRDPKRPRIEGGGPGGRGIGEKGLARVKQGEESRRREKERQEAQANRHSALAFLRQLPLDMSKDAVCHWMGVLGRYMDQVEGGKVPRGNDKPAGHSENGREGHGEAKDSSEEKAAQGEEEAKDSSEEKVAEGEKEAKDSICAKTECAEEEEAAMDCEAAAEVGGGAREAAAEQEPVTEVHALEAMRELQSIHVNLHLLEATAVGQVLSRVAQGPNKVLVRLANLLLQQWLSALYQHIEGLAKPLEGPGAPGAGPPCYPQPYAGQYGGQYGSPYAVPPWAHPRGGEREREREREREAPRNATRRAEELFPSQDRKPKIAGYVKPASIEDDVDDVPAPPAPAPRPAPPDVGKEGLTSAPGVPAGGGEGEDVEMKTFEAAETAGGEQQLASECRSSS